MATRRWQRPRAPSLARRPGPPLREPRLFDFDFDLDLVASRPAVDAGLLPLFQGSRALARGFSLFLHHALSPTLSATNESNRIRALYPNRNRKCRPKSHLTAATSTAVSLVVLRGLIGVSSLSSLPRSLRRPALIPLPKPQPLSVSTPFASSVSSVLGWLGEFLFLWRTRWYCWASLWCDRVGEIAFDSACMGRYSVLSGCPRSVDIHDAKYLLVHSYACLSMLSLKPTGAMFIYTMRLRIDLARGVRLFSGALVP